MAYPKPLSEKSLERLYFQADLNAEKRTFLQKLFSVCAGLYGVIMVSNIWDMYRHLNCEKPVLRKKDILAFSGIARREPHSYYVYEADELFDEEPRRDTTRFVIDARLIGRGYYRFHLFYHLLETIGDLPYFLPDDILSFDPDAATREETALLTCLAKIKSANSEHIRPYGDPLPNTHRGKTLGEFSYMSYREEREIRLSTYEKEKQLLQERAALPVAEKLVRNFKDETLIGWQRESECIETLLNDATEAGAVLRPAQFNKLGKLIMDYHNSLHLWINRGWSPRDASVMFSCGRIDAPVLHSNPIPMSDDVNRKAMLEYLRSIGIDTSGMSD